MTLKNNGKKLLLAGFAGGSFLCPELVCPVRPRHIIRKKRSFAAFSLLRSSFLLVKWRSLRRALQADFMLA